MACGAQTSIGLISMAPGVSFRIGYPFRMRPCRVERRPERGFEPNFDAARGWPTLGYHCGAKNLAPKSTGAATRGIHMDPIGVPTRLRADFTPGATWWLRFKLNRLVRACGACVSPISWRLSERADSNLARRGLRLRAPFGKTQRLVLKSRRASSRGPDS